MPITFDEYVEIVDENGNKMEGKLVAKDLVAIEDADKNHFYGLPLKRVKVITTATCDNDKCENSSVGDDFVTRPKSFQFENDGDGSPDFVKTVSDMVIVSNYKNEKMLFCTPECSAAYFRRANRERIVDISSGKGTKTSLLEEVGG